MSGTFSKLQNIWGNISGKKVIICPKENAARERRARRLLHPTGSSTIELNPSRVRVVVFRDDKGVKQPLFDSQVNCEMEGEEQSSKSLCDMRSIERLEQSSSSSTSSVPPLSNSSGWAGSSAKNRRAGFIKRPSTDSELLGEMMFGSMPMKTIGNSVKVHYIRSTDQLMLTKMFSPGRKLMHQCSLTDYSDSCPLPGDVSSQTIERSIGPIPKNHSMINNIGRSLSPDSGRQFRSSSLSVPILRPGSSLSSLSTHSSPHTHSPPSPLHSLNINGSVGSNLSRRIQRSRTTSLENASELYRKVLKPLDQPQQSSKKRKYGIGVILSLSELSEPDIQHFQSFLFSHFTLIDAHLEKLKSCVIDVAHCRGPAFTQVLTKAYQEFLKDFLSLYKAPRIESPVWLSLVSHVDRRREVCLQFMEEFGSCIVEMESKERKFFLSSLLTAVLSHHLAWVFTVSRQTSDSRFNKTLPKSLGVLAESHPYNPLWAQLGDMFGAVSTPLKLSRTIVTGKNSANVCRLLYILTYFIRCSEVEPWKVQDTPLGSLSERKPSEKQTLKIPVPRQRSHDVSHDMSPGEVHNLLHNLDDNDMFESRASSVTVISEHDPNSSVTPFASPVNIGRDTPVIKPHPFSIRGITHQLSTGSDADSIDSGSRSLTAATCGSSGRSPRKSSLSSRSSEFSGSQQLHSSLKRNTSSSVARQPGPIASTGQVTSNEMTSTESGDTDSTQCNCHYGNPSSCAFLASCESMGFCPLPDGFVTFDPTKLDSKGNCRSSQSSNTPLSECCSTEGCSYYDPNNSNYPLHQLATMNMLGPCHEHRMCKFHYQQHHSSSSIDSGYDRSLTASSATDCSKDSCMSTATGFSDSLFTSCTSSWQRDQFATKDMSIGTNTFQSMPLGRPRSDAISFSSRRVAASSGYRQNASKLPQDTITESQEISGYYSASDLPSPTQPLIPTKLSRLVEDGETYFQSVQINTQQASEQNPNTSEYHRDTSEYPRITSEYPRDTTVYYRETSNFSVPVSRVPLVQVQEPTFIRDEDCQSPTENVQSKLTFNHHSYQCTGSNCRDSTPQYCSESSERCTPDSDSSPVMNGSPGRSLRRQTALPSESDSTCSLPRDLDTTHDTIGYYNGSNSPESPSQSIPLSSISQVPLYESARDRSSSGALQADSLSMLSESDSGRGTKSWITNDFSHRDIETLSQSPLSQSSAELYDSDDAFVSNYQCDRNGMCTLKAQCTTGEPNMLSVDDDFLDVEKSLSADTLRMFRQSPSLLQQKLQAYDKVTSGCSQPMTLQQFSDFEDIPLPSLDDFHLDLPSDGYHDDQEHQRQNLSDFGHSLFVGHSPSYLSDFVLHGTSQPLDQQFHDKLVRDLASTVKHSIIDEPIEHGVAIVADTDTWTVKIVASSRSLQTNDVIMGSTNVQPSRYIKQMLSTIRSMYEMRLPAEFCLSHVEDRLLELNERSMTLVNTLMEYGSDTDFGEILPKTLDTLGVQDQNDRSLLIVLAGVNCPDPDIRARLNHIHMTRLLGKQYF